MKSPLIIKFSLDYTHNNKYQIIVVFILNKILIKFTLSGISKKSPKNVVFLLKKSTQPRRNMKFYIKKNYFFTQKEHPASQKIEVLHEKMTKNWQKKVPKRAPSPAKTWSFAWKIENRPTSGDFEKKNSRPPTSPNF